MSLFSEVTQHEATDPSPYSLNPDVPGKVCIRQVYMDCADPTEYKFAIEAFGSWAHWEAIRNAGWFRNTLESMRSELQAKLASDGVERYAALARKGDAAAVKWFAEAQFAKHTKDKDDKGKNKRGRPTSTEVKAALSAEVASAKDELEMARRLGLVDE